MGTRLLIDEEPLQVLPSLAVAIGLNEAIILQQMHYWLKKSEHRMEGKAWIYNSYEQWHTQFPFWGVNTIKRAVWQLEELGIITTTARFNRNPIDKTRWYTINYERLTDFCRPTTDHHGSSTDHHGSSTDHHGSSTDHHGLLDEPSWVARQTIMVRLPEITSEITTEIPDPPFHPPEGDEAAMQESLSTGTTRLQPTYTPGFLRFWDVYPHARRVSKPSCFKVWKKARLEPRTEEVCALITALLHTTWKDKPVTYIPTTMTWFNQGRYDDDLPVAATNPREWAWVKEEEAKEARRAGA